MNDSYTIEDVFSAGRLPGAVRSPRSSPAVDSPMDRLPLVQGGDSRSSTGAPRHESEGRHDLIRESLRAVEAVVDIPQSGTLPEFSRLRAELERRIDHAPSTGVNMPTYRGGFALGVTSAVAGEGKTTVALHLALSTARDTFSSVCIVDLSLHGDDLCARLGLDVPESGIIDSLETPDNVPPLVRLEVPGADELYLMPAGRAPVNAARAARSPRVGELIRMAREAFDLVIVDLPPVSTDNALPIAGYLDGLLMVARAGATPAPVIKRALARLDQTEVLGLVLNRV